MEKKQAGMNRVSCRMNLPAFPGHVTAMHLPAHDMLSWCIYLVSAN
jgi:hypothetical protein